MTCLQAQVERVLRHPAICREVVVDALNDRLSFDVDLSIADWFIDDSSPEALAEMVSDQLWLMDKKELKLLFRGY